MSVNKFVLISSFLITNIVLIDFIAKSFQFYKFICVLLISPIISWFVSNAIYRRLCVQRVSTNDKAVLITGCDTGFGHELAKTCDKLGFHVFAGCLNPDQNVANELREVCSQRLRVVKMDVTKHEEVVNVINEIKNSDLKLWSVVNNAGICITAPIEWGFDVREANQIFSVNVLGAIRVSKLCLPLLRQSKGRIINVSSIAGRMTTSGMTFYCMSKHAVRSLSSGLRQELNSLGIKVINIEPVLYRTPICDWDILKKGLDRVWEETPEEVKSVYSDNFRKGYEKQSKNFLKTTRKQTQEVIEVMTNAITLIEPQNNYKCGGILDYISTFPMSYLPEDIQQLILKYGLRNAVLNKIFTVFSSKT